MLSLALLAQGPANASPQTVSSTVDLVIGQLRVQGRTAYVAACKGGCKAFAAHCGSLWSPRPAMTTALSPSAPATSIKMSYNYYRYVMYFKTPFDGHVITGACGAASLEDQALALLLLVRTGSKIPLLPQLAAYIANPTTVSGGGTGAVFVCPPSYRAQGLAVLALSEYDRSRGSAQPNLDLSARANGLIVLQVRTFLNSQPQQ